MDVRKIPKASSDLPQGTLHVPLTTLMASATAETISPSEKNVFIPAQKFKGQKRGYIFTKGERGLGYPPFYFQCF